MATEGDPQRAAFRTTLLVSNFDGKIECITHYSSRVLIGSNDGRLVMYDTRKGTSGPPSCSYTFPHARPIEQILAIPHIRMVMVISNNELTAHAATDLQPLEFDFTKVNQYGVKGMCINLRGPPHFRLGLSLLRKKLIVIFQYHNSDKTYKYLREFQTNDIPETMAWYRNKVIVGYRNDYHILNDKSGEHQAINSPGIQSSHTFPFVQLLPKEEILLTVIDKVGVFVGLNGEPLPKNSINWTQSPSMITYTSSYLLGMIPRVGIEICNTLDHTSVQLISIPRVCCMFGNGMKWDMEPRPHGDSEDVVVIGVRDSNGNTSSVFKVEQMPIDQQIGELLDLGKIEEAQDIIKKSLHGVPSDKQRSKIKRFQRQAAVALLRRLEFDAAVDYMYRASIEPCELLAFFPEFQCPSFAYEPSILKPEVLPRGTSSSPDIVSVVNEILSTSNVTLSSEIVRTRPQDLVLAATKALMKLLDMYKKHVREKLASSTRSGISSSSKDTRRHEAIDTALFRLYVAFNKQAELLVLIEENGITTSGDGCHLDMEACQSLLLTNRFYYEMGHLFLTQGKYREAVELYYRLYIGEYKQHSSNPCPKKPCDAAIDVLIETDETYDTFVYEQSIWIMKATTVKNAMRMFTERRVKMNSNDVVEHLKKHSDDPMIVQKYLETLVKSEREQFNATSTSGAGLNPSTTGTKSSKYAGEVNDSYSNFLAGDGDNDAFEDSMTHTIDPHHTRLAVEYIDEVLKLVAAGETPSKSHPGKETGPLGDTRKRLLKFLKSSTSRYDVSSLVSKIQKTPLYNELVILCGRGGLHEEAVRALVYELNDLKGAENYAVKYGVKKSRVNVNGEPSKRTERNDALLALVKICFNPEDESKRTTFNDYGFQVLARHGKLMDGKAVLELIPSTTPLYKVVEYLSQSLPHSAHNVRETRITKALSNIYLLQVQIDRVQKYNASVEIDSHTLCLVCKKRIGDIVFATYPNGKVVHFNCANGKLDTCPVTGEKFS